MCLHIWQQVQWLIDMQRSEDNCGTQGSNPVMRVLQKALLLAEPFACPWTLLLYHSSVCPSSASTTVWCLHGNSLLPGGGGDSDEEVRLRWGSRQQRCVNGGHNWTQWSTPVTPAARCAAGASIASSRTRCPYETWALVLTRLPSDTKCWGWASGCAQHSGHCCEFRARWATSELQAVRDKRWEPVLKYFRAREMTWWLRALAALSGDPGSILSLMSMSND